MHVTRNAIALDMSAGVTLGLVGLYQALIKYRRHHSCLRWPGSCRYDRPNLHDQRWQLSLDCNSHDPRQKLVRPRPSRLALPQPREQGTGDDNVGDHLACGGDHQQPAAPFERAGSGVDEDGSDDAACEACQAAWSVDSTAGPVMSCDGGGQGWWVY